MTDLIQTLIADGVIEVDPKRRGGVPVLSGTRMPVAQVLANLWDWSGRELVRDYDLNMYATHRLITVIAAYFDSPPEETEDA